MAQKRRRTPRRSNEKGRGDEKAEAFVIGLANALLRRSGVQWTVSAPPPSDCNAPRDFHVQI